MQSSVRNIVFILNPVAGRIRASTRAVIEQSLRAVYAAAQLLLTEAPGHATVLARQAAADGADVVVAVGGDGTASEVAAGLLRSGATLAVVPAGNGNDLARSLGMPANWRGALAALRLARPAMIDVGHMQGRVFLQSAGVGIDAYVGLLRQRERRLSGALAYAKCAVEGLLTYPPREMTLELDGHRWRQRALAVTVANGETYGGGMRIAPGAAWDDGLLDVCLIGDLGRLDALRMFPTVYWGGHVGHPRFRLIRGRRLSVAADDPLPVHADGDAAGVTPVEFSVEPAALQVLRLPKRRGASALGAGERVG
jgi:YegS/Rv2252/BmrU family lipid kinase